MRQISSWWRKFLLKRIQERSARNNVLTSSQTRLAVRTFAVNRSARYFTDPDQFVPKRWLPKGERPVRYNNDRHTASQPFSVGYHRCLGRPLAWAELRLVVTRLLWAFDFAEEPTRRVSFDDFPTIMLIQKEPMMLRVKLRSDEAVPAKV